MLPGSRIPDPSILRTHPVTAERVARLMALKAAPGGPDSAGHPGVAVAVPRPRPSLVPKIRMAPGSHLPRASAPGNNSWPGSPHIAALMPELPAADMSDAGQDDAESIDDSVPACDVSLNPPQSEPRVRMMRGGVWW